MRRICAALVAAILFSSTVLHAEMDIAPPVKITWNGFLTHWASLGENSKFEYTQGGSGARFMLLVFSFAATGNFMASPACGAEWPVRYSCPDCR